MLMSVACFVALSYLMYAGAWELQYEGLAGQRVSKMVFRIPPFFVMLVALKNLAAADGPLPSFSFS